jgi:thiol:disulfide interchange protein DsbC
MQTRLRMQSLLDKEREEVLAWIVQHLPLEKAIKIGNGSNKIIEFCDPDCPFSRRVNNYLTKVKNSTRYIILYPLPVHPDAAQKTAYILSAKDTVTAYREVFAGKFDRLPVPAQSAEAMRLSNEHFAIAQRYGIRGTPTLWINGNYMIGADLNRIATCIHRERRQIWETLLSIFFG